MILVVAALYDELHEILKRAEFVREGNFRYYRFQEFLFFLIGPGLRRKKKLLDFIEYAEVQTVVLTGFCGSLHSDLSVGEFVQVSQAGEEGSRFLSVPTLESLNFKTGKVFSVKRIVYSDSEREALRKTGADCVDLESYAATRLFSDISIKFHILKIVGDAPGDEQYLRQEEALRNFSRERSLIAKMQTLFRAGLWSSLKVLRRKRRLQKKLAEAVETLYKKS